MNAPIAGPPVIIVSTSTVRRRPATVRPVCSEFTKKG
jgi:hypothetical protein